VRLGFRSLCDDFVAKLLEFVADLVRDLERGGAILIGIGRDHAEAALRGLKQQTQTADSVDPWPGRERDHETRASGGRLR
jgi:hypothetical protein